MEILHLFIYNKDMENSKYLTVGFIVRTRGLKGVLKIKSTSYFAKIRYQKGNKLYLYNEKDNIRIPVTAETYSNEGEFDFVSFKEYGDISLVEKYIGWAVQVNRDEIPDLPKDMFYYSDLEGLDCADENGAVFGSVLKIEDFTAQPSFRIRLIDAERTVLIPFVEFYVKKVDLENKRIIFHLIPGLIEE